MKKETKKKIINTSLITALTAAAVTPVAVALGNLNNNAEKLDVNTNAGFISGDVKIDKYNHLTTPTDPFANETPLTSKAIPNGYVTVMNTSKNTLVCLNKDNPTIIEWTLNIPTGANRIAAIEYNSYYDSIGVIYYTSGSDIVYYGVKDKISTYTGGAKLGFGYYTKMPVTGNGNKKANTWKLQPMFATSSNDAPNGSSKWFIAYCAAWAYNRNRPYAVILEASETSTWKMEFKMNFFTERNYWGKWEEDTHKTATIAGLVCYWYSGKPNIVAYVKYWDDYWKYHASEIVFMRNGLIYSKSGNLYKWSDGVSPYPMIANTELNASEWGSGDVKYDGKNLTFLFFAAHGYYDYLNGPRSYPVAAKAWFNINQSSNENGFSMGSKVEPLFYNQTDSDAMLYNGYFDTSRKVKYGIIGSGNYHSPIVGLGWSYALNNRISFGLFAFTIFSYYNDYKPLTSNTNWNSAKFYRFREGGGYYQSNIAWPSHEYGGGLYHVYESGYNQYHAFRLNITGFPILEYNPEYVGVDGLDKRNILIGHNLSNKVFVINNKYTSKLVDSPAHYAYWTQPKSTVRSFAFGDPSVGIYTQVTPTYLETLLNLNMDPWTSSKLLGADGLNMQQVKEDSIFRIKPDSLVKKTNKADQTAQVTFDLYATDVYGNTGQQHSISNADLEKNWPASNKIATVTITGFKFELITEAPNEYTLPIRLNAGGEVPYLLHPLLVYENHKVSNLTFFDNFKLMIWKTICGELVQEPLFANLRVQPTYSLGTWKEEFVKYVGGFKIRSYDLETSSVVLEILMKKEMIYSNTYADKTFVITLKGLRSIGKTVLKGNTLNNPFSIADTPLAKLNIPYKSGTHTTYNSAIQDINTYNGAALVTEGQIREFIWSTIFEPAYAAANAENGYNPNNEWVWSLPFKKKDQRLSALSNEQELLNYKIDKNMDFYFRDWKFYPVNGTLSFTLRLRVWNGGQYNTYFGVRWASPAQLEGVTGSTTEVANEITATYYITGFRNDNVTTEYDEVETWNLEGVNDILITNIFSNSNYHTRVWKALKQEAIKNNRIKVPYWVDLNNVSENLFWYSEPENPNVNEGTGLLPLRLGYNNWRAQSDGTVVNNDEKAKINISGFLKVSPIFIDSSQMFVISQDLNTTLNKIFYLKPGLSSTDFRNWLVAITSKFTDYVVTKDKETNLEGAQPLAVWQKRLTYTFKLETIDSVQEYTISELETALNDRLNQSNGMLNHLFTSLLNKGVKIWIKVKDSGVDEQGNSYPAVIQDNSTMPEKGQNFVGLVDTALFVSDIDMRKWLNNLSTKKGTEAVNATDISIDSIIPPQLPNDSNSPGKGMTFEEIVNYLISIGYQTEYSWYNQNGVLLTQSEFPTLFNYSSEKPWMDFKIYYTGTGTNVPPIYIFGDATHVTKEYTARFSFNVLKTISLDLSPFATMISSDIFNQTSTNIFINKDGTYNLSTVQKIVTAWRAYEESIWKYWGRDDESIQELKSSFEIKYYINGSTTTYTSSEMWTPISESWANALNDASLSKIGLLRFYSSAFKSGTKIQVTVQPKPNADPGLKLNLLSDKQIVNHGLGTTYDFSDLAQFYQTNKAQVAEGSVADRLLGFTLPAYKQVPFTTLKSKLESELGVIFQWSNDNKTWYDNEAEIRSVNSNDPAIYLRLSSKTTDHLTWSNEFEIANFASGTTDSTSSDEKVKYSSGIKIPLNLPKFIKVDSAWVQDFINKTKALWSGNTKNMLITSAQMNTQISALINKIITENKITDLKESNFNVEFKINTSNGVDGTAFTKFSSTLVDTIAAGNSWSTFANGVQLRIILNGANDGNEYDKIETSYESDQQLYALKTSVIPYFENTGNLNDYQAQVNPIKIYVPTAEEIVQKITAQGTDIFNVSYSYPTPMYFDANDQKVYVDNTKRLIVQFSSKKLENTNAGYNDASANWSYIPPKELTIDKYVFVRVIINPSYTNFVYGPADEKIAKAWQLDTKAIKPIISADISKLRSIIIDGILNPGGTNQFNNSAIKSAETAAINEAIKEITGRAKVAVVYNLKLSSADTNNTWMTLDELLAKLQKEVEAYSSSTYGIASFLANQFILSASLVSIDPEYQVRDSVTNDFEVVNKGIVLDTSKIKTNIDLTTWINFLKATKTLVIEKPKFFSARSVVSLNDKYLQPPTMLGETTSGFLAGRTFKEIYEKLKVVYGVNFAFSTDNATWVDNIELLQSFDDSVNKVYVKINQSTSTPQINVMYNATSITTLPFEMNIQYPKTLTVDQKWISEFVASNPVTGNTKYLTIDANAEKTLVDKVVTANPPVGKDPKPNVWVEYRIGSNGSWYNRVDFINHLKSQTVDQTTNLIQMKLVVDPVNPNEPLYNISDAVTTVSEHDISLSTKIKIYVNKSYETIAEGLEVIGTISVSGDTKLTYNYKSLPVDPTGKWNGDKGLKIQWSLDDTALYSDPVDSSKWLNIQPTTIDPVKRYLSFRIIEEFGYQYSANYTNPAENIAPNAKVHIFDTSKIFSEIKVDLATLKDKLVFQGQSNNLDLTVLKNSEKEALKFDGGDKLEVKYKVTLSDGSQLSDVWMTADELNAKLAEYSKDYTSKSQGLIKFSTDTFISGATIEATYVVKQEFVNNYQPYDPANNVTKGISTNTSRVITTVDLSKYFVVLKNKAVSALTTANGLSIVPPAMTGVKGSGFLAGLTYDEIVTILDKVGIKVEFLAPGFNNEQWVSLATITQLNNANELFARFTTRESSLDSTVAILGTNQQQQNNQNPEKVQLFVDLPITIMVDRMDLNQLAFEGTTINITNLATLKTKEADLIKQIKDKNKTGTASTDALIAAADIVVLYSLNEKVLNSAAATTPVDKRIWMSLDEIQSVFSRSKENFGTNRVLAKFFIANNTQNASSGVWKYQLSDEKSQVINETYLSHEAPFKAYIHNIESTSKIWIYDNLKVTGTQDVYKINNLSSWMTNIPQGLVVEFNSVDVGTPENPTPDANAWSTTYNENQIGESRAYWIRFRVEPGFVFENASATDPKVSDPIQLDTSKLFSKITVDLSVIKQKLVLSGASNALDLAKLKESEKQALAINNGDKLEIKYKVTLSDGSQLSDVWMTADELNAKLAEYSKDYSKESQGLIKFSTDTFVGATIEATYVVKPEFSEQFEVVDPTHDVSKGIATNTTNVVTTVDLSQYFEILKSVAVKVAVNGEQITSLTPPAMTGVKGSGFLAGLTYDEIVNVLSKAGIKAEFKAPGMNSDQWVGLSSITQLNNGNDLFIRFTTDVQKYSDLDTSVVILGTNKVAQDNQKPEEIKLIVNLPLTIKVDTNELKQLAFEGTTINITNLANLKASEVALIQQIKNNNKTGVVDTDQKIEAAEIVVLYSLNELVINSSAVTTPVDKRIWMTLDEMQAALSNSKTNFGTNKVLAKFYIANNETIDDQGTMKYKLSNELPITINEAQFTDQAKFKIYIHNVDATDPTWMYQVLKVKGTQEEYSIENFTTWMSSIPFGMEVEFNSVEKQLDDKSFVPDEAGWSAQYNTNRISSNRNYWVRFKIKPGFVFERPSATNEKLTDPIKLDCSKVQVSLNVQSDWLNSIILSGSTKALTINEDAAMKKVVDNGMMPLDKIIQIEYTVDGINWFKKDQFITELDRLDGGIDSTKWIIMREDIRARFVLNKELNATQNPPYGLVVDGKIIEKEEQSTPIQLVKENQNQGVKGYINANKLTPFVAQNFIVRGTNTNANLFINDPNALNQMLKPYESSNIFTILYTSEPNVFIDSQKLWVPGTDLKAQMPILGDYANRYFALQLKSTNANYIVYHDDVEQANGYVIQTPDIAIYISIAITNPLADKKVTIQYKNKKADGTFEPIFYQNNGAFIVYVENTDGTSQALTFKEFINSLPTGTNTAAGEYTNEMKEALELVYYVAPSALTDEEYAEVISKERINNYEEGKSTNKYGVWKTYPSNQDINSLDLGLLVNDYVIVALRVKEDKLVSEVNQNGYSLKDDNHTPTRQSRAHGFKVHADQVNVDWTSMNIKNVGKAETAPYGLDGYAMLQTISLIQDQEKNYQGVSLKLNLFTEFHRDAAGQILVSGAGDRLVKRNTSAGVSTGKYYTDIEGNPLTDASGQQIQIYESANGLPCPPIKESAVTRSKGLIESNNYLFALELSNLDVTAEYSLFKYQTIQIEFENKKGLADPYDDTAYDYYVDQKVTRDYTIDTEIKLPIPNDTNIEYKFNSDDFKKYIVNNVNLAYENSVDSSLGPINGQSKLVHMFEMTRTENGQVAQKFDTIQSIRDQIQKDFGNKVVLKITYTSQSGVVQLVDNLSDITNLSNGDKFKIEIVSADENNYIYAQQPDPLLFTISGLFEKGLEDLSLLQHLRVKQIGEFNGEGKFGIYINDPATGDMSVDIPTYLGGFTFQIRVWDKNKEIKHNWTSDLASVQNLENGDWVEWKLVSASSGADILNPYYNTVANVAKHNANANQYVYEQVLQSGQNNINLNPAIQGIGQMPIDVNTYPGDRQTATGFVIADLKEKSIDDEFTTISYNEFVRIMESMNFQYTGINGHGNMVSVKDVAEVKVNIESKARAQFTLAYLIEKGYVKFYYNNSTSTELNSFNWNQVKGADGNWLSAPGILSNGDIIRIQYKDHVTTTAYEWFAPVVSGLDEKADSMSMMAWVGVATASLATLGVFAIIYFLARNRKLKNKLQ